ncbi:uncharacterized protein LOC129950530 [Eupeodes corollae]|uniref:uncharacterized protein LOC129950530 n=1 Tax=Eupeodes corollae TaxID=290404 RepID=UPI00249305B4|nr:uncharacterized protein LOC129950530 [Eupeodes corollae]
MASIGSIEAFDVANPAAWGSYRKRFERFLLANGITTAEIQKATFLTICGSHCFNLVESLISPKTLEQHTYKSIIEELTQHFTPAPSEIASFYRFFKRDQQSNESVAEYIAELLIIDCNFDGTMVDRILRDRLVCGLRNTHLQKSLLAETKLTLKSVQHRAIAAENAAKSQLVIQQAVPQQDHVHAIKSRPQKHQHHNPRTADDDKTVSREKNQKQQTCFSCGN